MEDRAASAAPFLLLPLNGRFVSRLWYHSTMRARDGWRRAIAVAIVTAAGLCTARVAVACSPRQPAAPTALPASGATNVSTATSIIVIAGSPQAHVTLHANGQPVPLLAPVSIGGGATSVGWTAGYWQLRPSTPDGMLVPDAEHVLRAVKQDGSEVELTRFTTASGYDKTEAVAPSIRNVRFWRVRYPLSDIASGNCVFAEYHGFIHVDYEAAQIPNTPASSHVYTFRLAPKTGGSAQAFTYAGPDLFKGTEPSGDHPSPVGLWQPELDPSREYCLTISAVGDGDIARLPAVSAPACAAVTQLSATGAPPPAGMAGQGGTNNAPPSTGGGGRTAGTAANGTERGACAFAGGQGSSEPAWLLLLAAICRLRRRTEVQGRGDSARLSLIRPPSDSSGATGGSALSSRLRPASSGRTRSWAV